MCIGGTARVSIFNCGGAIKDIMHIFYSKIWSTTVFEIIGVVAAPMLCQFSNKKSLFEFYQMILTKIY